MPDFKQIVKRNRFPNGGYDMWKAVDEAMNAFPEHNFKYVKKKCLDVIEGVRFHEQALQNMKERGIH